MDIGDELICKDDYEGSYIRFRKGYKYIVNFITKYNIYMGPYLNEDVPLLNIEPFQYYYSTIPRNNYIWFHFYTLKELRILKLKKICGQNEN